MLVLRPAVSEWRFTPETRQLVNATWAIRRHLVSIAAQTSHKRATIVPDWNRQICFCSRVSNPCGISARETRSCKASSFGRDSRVLIEVIGPDRKRIHSPECSRGHRTIFSSEPSHRALKQFNGHSREKLRGSGPETHEFQN